MSKNEKVVGSMSDWSGMLKDLFRQIDDGSIELSHLRALLEHQDPFKRKDVSSQVMRWKGFYKRFFGIDVDYIDFSKVKIPEKKDGFDRLIVVAQDITPDHVFDLCRKNFPSWRYYRDLNEETRGRNDREPTQSYAIWVRDRAEADEELKNIHSETLRERGIKGITLLERLIFELKYWEETDRHLDVHNYTLCTGSRYSNARVPDAHWDRNDVKFRVGQFSSLSVHPCFCARAVVS